MMNLFSKYKKIKEEDFIFLKKVLEKTNYSFMIDDLNRELFASKTISKKGEMYGYALILFHEKASKIEKKRKLGNFILKNIYVKDKQGKIIEVELEFIDGILRYYHFDISVKIKNLNLNSIDVDKVKEHKYSNSYLSTVLNLLGEIPRTINDLLDINSTFLIELEEGYFYPIKDYGDGDCLAISSKGEIFGLIHDPWEVEYLFQNSEDFFNALKNNTFNISDYYDKKML